MTIFLANRVHVEVSTSGTADFVVGAAISTAYQSFAGASVPDGATFSYVAYTATQFECARGAYILGTTTVDRTAANVIAGSAGAGALTNFSTTPRLFIGPLAEDLVKYDASGAVQPGANDGGSLGVSGTAWSDLFLASGGVINFDASDVTLTHSANTLTLGGGNLALGSNKITGLSKTIAVVFDGGGSALTTGVKGDLEISEACTIQQATLLADQSGSVVVDIWKDTYANYPPTDADSITASAPPTITAATKSQDGTLTGWTTAITAGDILRFNVDSAATVTRVTLALKVVTA